MDTPPQPTSYGNRETYLLDALCAISIETGNLRRDRCKHDSHEQIPNANPFKLYSTDDGLIHEPLQTRMLLPILFSYGFQRIPVIFRVPVQVLLDNFDAFPQVIYFAFQCLYSARE